MDRIQLITVRGCGVRDIAIIASVSIGKVLSTIGSSVYKIAPKKRHYERLEVDEFWTYVYRKKHKVWLIYAYDSATNDAADLYGFDYVTKLNLKKYSSAYFPKYINGNN